MKKVSNKFHQGTKTMITFFDEFAGIALKLETGGPSFSSFNSLTSLPSVAKEDWKQFQGHTIVYEKTGAMFLNSTDGKKSFIFSKR